MSLCKFCGPYRTIAIQSLKEDNLSITVKLHQKISWFQSVCIHVYLGINFTYMIQLKCNAT